MFRFTRFFFFKFLGVLLKLLVDHILITKNQATDRKTEKLGHKYRYWIPMIDPIDRNGRKIVGLYHYDAVAKK